MIAERNETRLVYSFTQEDHFNAEREGFIRQINSFSQKGHREFGRYDFRDGLYGEIAFARWAEIERAPAEQGVLNDGGVDFVDSGNIRIDVKATGARGAWRSAHLLRPRSASLKSDVYVLIVLDFKKNRARFAGWATKEEMMAAPIKRQGDDGRPQVYTPTRVIPEQELHHDWMGWRHS